MKLVVCTNFAHPFHTGGAEKVVQQITESMTKDYGCECTVLCQYGQGTVSNNGVKIETVGLYSEEKFLQTINDISPDCLFVYSDWFFRWDTILKNSEKIKANKSIAMVGMNRMRSLLDRNKVVADLFRQKHKQFKVITHAPNYFDSIICKEWGIPFTVIHNAINLLEFENINNSFREKHKIKTAKMLLCVSNFFPGKGQEYLLPILRNIKSKHDLTLVCIYSKLAFEPGNRLQNLIEENSKRMNLPIRFLRDIPRKEVVESYFASDAFVFPSRTECGPIVLLESMAAKKPWISMNVGHVADLKGGFCVNSVLEKNGLTAFNSSVSQNFELHINNLLTNKELSSNLGEEGRKQIEQEYNWEIVKDKYWNFFKNA